MRRKPFVVGLTGGFATGKTTVARMFKRLGARVVDCDRIAHEALKPGYPVYRKILRAFRSDGIAGRQGKINRQKLAAAVFRRPGKRKRLEAIVHPYVFREIDRAVRKAGEMVAVLEVPLLFETGFDKKVDAVAVVSAPHRVQIRRALKKYGWSRPEIEARIRAQWPLAAKKARADFIIHNEHTVAETAAQVRKLWEKWKRKNL